MDNNNSTNLMFLLAGAIFFTGFNSYALISGCNDHPDEEVIEETVEETTCNPMPGFNYQLNNGGEAYIWANSGWQVDYYTKQGEAKAFRASIDTFCANSKHEPMSSDWGVHVAWKQCKPEVEDSNSD